MSARHLVKTLEVWVDRNRTNPPYGNEFLKRRRLPSAAQLLQCDVEFRAQISRSGAQKNILAVGIRAVGSNQAFLQDRPRAFLMNSHLPLSTIYNMETGHQCIATDCSGKTTSPWRIQKLLALLA
jgi:hypothetical protein